MAVRFGDDSDGVQNSGVQVGLVVRATRTEPFGYAARSSMLRTRKTRPWAWPGLPGRPAKKVGEEAEEVEEVQEADSGEGEIVSVAPEFTGSCCGEEARV
jgi:hypothetical protein